MAENKTIKELPRISETLGRILIQFSRKTGIELSCAFASGT